MAKCDVCGNDYDKSFTVTMAGKMYVFDSFECAIHRLAPVCQHCGCHVIGHGVEKDGTIFCCSHCAEQQGVHGLTDRVPKAGFIYGPHGHEFGHPGHDGEVPASQPAMVPP